MKHKYLKDAATLMLDTSKCNGCSMCTKVCPHNVLEIRDGKAEIIDRDSCMECGACALNCPFSALSVKPGVGCAAAIITGLLTGSEPACGCSGTEEDSGSAGGCC